MQILIYDNLPFLLKLCYTVRKRTTEIGMIESGMPMETAANAVRFTLGGLIFEYDPEKNRKNIEKHGISFKNAARVFFDYDRIELYDEAHSGDEDRYDTIGSIFAGNLTVIGNLQDTQRINDILFVVYTERAIIDEGGRSREVTRLISARLATSFERGVYMANAADMTREVINELAFTPEELKELERARTMPITFDEDCPETTPERAMKFRRVNPVRRVAN